MTSPKLQKILKVLSIATVNPPHVCTLDKAVAQSELWTLGQDEDFRQKVSKIFRNAAVEKRYSILPVDEIFAPMSLDQKNSIYQDTIVDYAETALRNALQKADLEATDIDCIITTSCTGHMSPSLDAHLVNRLNMKNTVQRLPVTEMGCIGGAVGLMYAENYLRAYPDRYVALISAELTSITFQLKDFSWANIVSTAIFGDGIACAILGPSEANRPAITSSVMHHFPDTIDLLGFNLKNTGFHMVLDEHLPERIRENFNGFINPLLGKQALTLSDINHFIVHPGGKKILHNIELLIRGNGKDLFDSREVLRQYGNMSSATVLFILQRMLERDIAPGEKGLLMGFGPGLTASVLLLEWCEN